jgi:hypothetical protein
MYVYVLDEFQSWGKRGYHEPLECPRHVGSDILVGASPEGLYVKCALCLYKKIIGQEEYEIIRKANLKAEKVFQEE